MIIAVQHTGVSYTDIENFTRFHVDAHGLAPAAFAAQLATDSALVYDESAGAVWVYIAALRSAVPQAFAADFEAMIRYATSKGWVSDDGTQVRGHVEHLGAE